eukprot:8558777-Lingulodinium_polyedra.AAC.1
MLQGTWHQLAWLANRSAVKTLGLQTIGEHLMGTWLQTPHVANEFAQADAEEHTPDDVMIEHLEATLR